MREDFKVLAIVNTSHPETTIEVHNTHHFGGTLKLAMIYMYLKVK
jgi:hypothetical protein